MSAIPRSTRPQTFLGSSLAGRSSGSALLRGLPPLLLVVAVVLVLAPGASAAEGPEFPDAAKPDKPQVDKPQVDKPKVDKPKVDKRQVDRSQVDRSQVDKPKVDKPKVDKPQISKPPVPAPRIDKPPKPQVDKPQLDEPQADKPQVTVPKPGVGGPDTVPDLGSVTPQPQPVPVTPAPPSLGVPSATRPRSDQPAPRGPGIRVPAPTSSQRVGGTRQPPGSQQLPAPGDAAALQARTAPARPARIGQEKPSAAASSAASTGAERASANPQARVASRASVSAGDAADGAASLLATGELPMGLRPLPLAGVTQRLIDPFGSSAVPPMRRLATAVTLLGLLALTPWLLRGAYRLDTGRGRAPVKAKSRRNGWTRFRRNPRWW